MEEKIPFYKTFSMKNPYVAELEYEKDMDRVKEFYPKDIAFIQSAVEKHCDKLEYEGSRIFDEEPDKMMLEMEADRIVEELSVQVPQKKLYFEAVAQSYNSCRGMGDYLCNMVRVLFGNEIYRRRCRRRRCGHFW